MNHFSVIIVGGGCAGLSLAIHIAKKEPQQRILILENRPFYVHDRTWSFWDVASHPYETQIQHTWDRWQVRYQGHSLALLSAKYRYCCIPSNSFYEATTAEIALLPNVTLLMNSPVIRLIESAAEVVVETGQGEYRGDKVFDSRPEKSQTALYQHFLGWQVTAKRPLFDPKAVTLMDFDVDQSKGLHFMYLLPFSTHEALIESTFISPDVHDEHVYEEAISSYLKERFQAVSYRITRKERGILPLNTKLPEKGTAKVIPIGAKAGWTRASTGYAFLPIQHAIQTMSSDQCTPKSFSIDRCLDQIYLAFLQKHPELAPRVFFDLFRKNSPERLIRFLTGYWSPLDLLQVLLSMPKITMIKQTLQLISKGEA